MILWNHLVYLWNVSTTILSFTVTESYLWILGLPFLPRFAQNDDCGSSGKSHQKLLIHKYFQIINAGVIFRNIFYLINTFLSPVSPEGFQWIIELIWNINQIVCLKIPSPTVITFELRHRIFFLLFFPRLAQNDGSFFPLVAQNESLRLPIIISDKRIGPSISFSSASKLFCLPWVAQKISVWSLSAFPV